MSVPEPVPARPDRRVRRTREALRNALLALLVERGWDDIDVQALCVRTDIGRSTFYLHFPNKEALLRGSLAVSWSNDFAHTDRWKSPGQRT